MFSQPLKIVFLILLIFAFAHSTFAEEKKAEGEEPKAETAKSEKKDEYGETQAKVSALQAKIKASEETIHKLIEEKQQTKDENRVSDIVKEMVAEHKSMEKNVDEYEKARSYLQYRFPEKGLKGERVYERIEVKSLQQMGK